MQKPEKPKVYHSNKHNVGEIVIITAKIEKQQYVLSQIDESDLAQHEKVIKEIQLKVWLLAGLFFSFPLISIPMLHQKNNIVMWLTLEEEYRKLFPKNIHISLLLSLLGIPLILYEFDKDSKKKISPIVEKYEFIYEPYQTLQ